MVQRNHREYRIAQTFLRKGDQIRKAIEWANDNPDSVEHTSRIDGQDVLWLLNKVADADPTENKRYMGWIVTRVIRNEITGENLERVGEALLIYTDVKNTMSREGYDNNITRYSWLHFEDIMLSIRMMQPVDNTDLRKPVSSQFEGRRDVVVHYEGAYGYLISPLTEDAAEEFGSGTKWCVSVFIENEFENYNRRAPLYFWRDKSGEKIAMHFSRDLPRCDIMNSQNTPIDTRKLAKIAESRPPIKKLLMANHSLYAAYQADLMIEADESIPLEVICAISKSSELSYLFAMSLVEKHKPVPRIIWKRFADYNNCIVNFLSKVIPADSEQALEYAMLHVDIGQCVPGELESMISTHSQHSYEYAKYLLKQTLSVPDFILAGMLHKIRFAFWYAEGLVKEGKSVPGILSSELLKSKEFSDEYLALLRSNECS